MNKLYPSLETCKKIAHLFDKNTIKLRWYKYDDGSGYIASDGALDKFGAEVCICPNIAELLDRLPYRVLDNNIEDNYLRIHKDRDHYSCFYQLINSITSHDVLYTAHESLPEALAQLLLKLDGEGLL